LSDVTADGRISEINPLVDKDGMVQVKAKSLRQFVEDNHPQAAYRISMNDYRPEDWVTNIPLWAAESL
jgi:hypothetical protein